VKILFIGPLPDPVTGQSLACKVFLEELRKNNVVEVINLSKRGFKQGFNSISRIVEIILIIIKIFIKKKHADVIYFTIAESFSGNLKDIIIYSICFKKLSKMVVHLHGGAGMRVIMTNQNSMIFHLNKFFISRIGAMVVLGQRHLDIFRKCLPCNKLFIVPNFAEEYLFSSTEEIQHKFENLKPLKILFLSNLIPGKGYVEIVEAFASLDENLRCKFAVDFAGGFESDTEKVLFLSKINKIPQIKYHGIVGGKEKKQLLNSAHLFFLPTYYPYEGQPISILEAYASGCVVVTTDHSGIFDIFESNVNGYQVQKESVEDIKNVLIQLAIQSDDLLDMAVSNYSLARKNYRVPSYCSRLLHTISKVAA